MCSTLGFVVRYNADRLGLFTFALPATFYLCYSLLCGRPRLVGPPEGCAKFVTNSGSFLITPPHSSA